MRYIRTISIDLRKELFIYALCFFIAFCFNLGAVIAYSRPWSELFSQLGYVVAISLALYAFLLFLRGAAFLISTIFHKNNKH